MTPTPNPRDDRTPVRPLVLFGLLTLFTLLGPLAIVVVGRGGRHPSWPPDRAVEWGVLIGVSAGYVLLMLACLLDAWSSGRHQRPPGDRA